MTGRKAPWVTNGKNSYARSPFLEYGAHSSVLTQKEVTGITPIFSANEKNSDILDADESLPRGYTNYHVPNGFANSKMGKFGLILDTQLF